MKKEKGLARATAKGFTIIELIVVIAIVAVLAAIVMVSVTQYIRKAKHATELADIKQINTAAITYFGNHGNLDHLCGNYDSGGTPLFTVFPGDDSQIPAIATSINNLIVNNTANTQCYDTSDTIGCGTGSWVFMAQSPFNSSDPNKLFCTDFTGKIYESADEALTTEYGDGVDPEHPKCCCTGSLTILYPGTAHCQ